MQFSTVRKNRSNKKRKYQSRYIVLLVFALFLASFLVYRFVHALYNSKFIMQDHVGLIFHTDPAIFAFFNKKDEKYSLVSISSEAYIPATRGFGSYKLSSIWRLGEIENLSGSLASEAIQELLAVSVDGWIIFEDDPVIVSNDPIEAFSQTKLAVSKFSFLLRGSLNTNLGLIDRFLLIITLFKTPVEEFNSIALSETDAASIQELADKSEVLSIDSDVVDVLLSGWFEYQEIRKEALSIEILNAADRSFLGERVARLATAMGGHVVRVGNADELQDTCIIKGKRYVQQTKTVQVLNDLFECSFIEYESLEEREDIQFLIGERYANKLFGTVSKN